MKQSKLNASNWESILWTSLTKLKSKLKSVKNKIKSEINKIKSVENLKSYFDPQIFAISITIRDSIIK